MAVRNIVRGQRVSAKQVENAKQLRREMTPAEKILWKEVKAGKLNGLHFRRQQIVHGYFADLMDLTPNPFPNREGERTPPFL
jgi:very-short-patch-repair endonuclease